MPFKQILIFTSFSSPIILFIGISISYIIRKRLNTSYKLIAIYMVISFTIDILSRYLGLISKVHINLITIPIFALGEFAIFSYLYYRYILKSTSKIFAAFIIAILLLILLDIAFIDLYSSKSFNSYGKVLDNLSIMFFSLLFIWKSIKSSRKVEKDKILLNSGVLLFFSVNLLIYLPLNFLINGKSIITYYFWMINLFFTISFYIFLIYLIWQNGKTRKL